jgi:adenine-specific DNA-methyltransferase
VPETKREELQKLNLTTTPDSQERFQALINLFPEAVDESGRIDQSKLKECLGELADGDKERYNLSWAGKREAQRALQIPSSGTLVPVRNESVDFDTTQNVIIEGDNLEVLKLLQKAYHGKVQMIYIDPPYNTGNDFIYPDNFREGLQSYLEFTGQAKKKVVETEENLNRAGRLHSNWLNMMYPRLVLARNLLCEDGVIFVSIDDHEVHNLRLLMDETFGEENFTGAFVWERKKKPSFLKSNFGVVTEYILTYAKHKPSSPAFTAGTVEEGKLFPFNNAGNGVSVLTFPPASVAFTIEDQVVVSQDMSEGNITTVLLDDVHIVDGVNANEFRLRGEWRYSQSKLDEFVAAGDEVVIRKIPFRPNYVNRSDKAKKTTNLLSVKGSKTPTNEDATAELRDLFGRDVIDYPKPVGLLKYLVNAVAGRDAIVLDFFAGSGTTAHAVMELNQEDGGSRHFILVQLPELLDPSITLSDGTLLHSITDITRERVRRAAKKISANNEGKLDLDTSKSDLGFRSLRLAPSSFHPWVDTSKGDPEKLADLLRHHSNNIINGADSQAVLFEILLKSGHVCSTSVRRVKLKGSNETFAIDDGRLLVCLDNPVNEETLFGIIELEPEKIICLDHAFGGNDALKANFIQQIKQYRLARDGRPITVETV